MKNYHISLWQKRIVKQQKSFVDKILPMQETVYVDINIKEDLTYLKKYMTFRDFFHLQLILIMKQLILALLYYASFMRTKLLNRRSFFLIA